MILSTKKDWFWSFGWKMQLKRWENFFYVSLGLNSLSGSCVRENAVYATWRPDLVRWVDKIGIFFVSMWRFLTSRLINLTFDLISGNNLVSSVTKGMFNFSNSINSIMDWIPLKTVLTKTIELKYRNHSFKTSPSFHDFWPLSPSVDIFTTIRR